MAHQPIAIDCASADGRAEGAGSAEPGLPTDQGSVGASVEQVAVPSVLPLSSERTKEAVRYRVGNERRLPKPLKSKHWVWKFFMVYAKEALINIAVCRICEANGDLDNAEIRYTSPTHLRQHLETKRKGHREVLKDAGSSNSSSGGGGGDSSGSGTGAVGGGDASGEGQGTIVSYMDGVRPFTTLTTRFIVGSYQASSIVDHRDFKNMLHYLSKSQTVPSRRDIVRGINEVSAVLLAKIYSLIAGLHFSFTSDGWTSCANDTYHSFTISLIDGGWVLRTLSLDCSKASGSAKGEDLAAAVIAQVVKHKLEGRAVAFVTDCEPSMVKAGRQVEAEGVAEHHGCVAHRLECITGVAFDGPGTRDSMAHARLCVRRYTKSSQAAHRLAECQVFLGMAALKVIQDVETRWWSTHSCLERLVYLKPAIQMHEAELARASRTTYQPVLSEVDWAVIELLVPFLEPFMVVQRLLEGEKYVTVSLVVPAIQGLRFGLREGIHDLQADPPHSTPAHQLEATALVIICALALMDDFDRRWGDGTNLLEYRAGPRQQPQGFKRWQLVATALDWRVKNVLFGFDKNDKEELWALVVTETAAMVLADRATPTPPTSASPALVESEDGPTASVTAANKKARFTGFLAAAQSQSVHVEEGDGGGGIGTDADSIRRGVTHAVSTEVAMFRKASGMLMFRDEKNAKGEVKTVYNNPLDMWRKRAKEFPYLARLARRVLSIPATQAQSERMFSAAGLTVNKRRGSLDPENVELLVFLRCNWDAVDKWLKE